MNFLYKYSMLDVFLNRKTQRSFTDREISQDHLNQILKAGCSAPSKQRAYPWRVIALTRSETALEIKNKLFTDSFINVPVKKHLLTAKAPLLLAWIGVPILDNYDLGLIKNNNNVRQLGKTRLKTAVDPKTQYTVRTRAEKDTMVAASFSMIQAESLGYNTAFTSCFLEDTACKILNLESHEWPIIFLSIGFPEEIQTRNDVIKNNQIIGFSDPRPFPEPEKLGPEELSMVI